MISILTQRRSRFVQIDFARTLHCVKYCVRRAFLCGIDDESLAERWWMLFPVRVDHLKVFEQKRQRTLDDFFTELRWRRGDLSWFARSSR
jgi:hypothetical protein